MTEAKLGGERANSGPAELKAIATRVRAGETPVATVRTLIGWFGQKRRGNAANQTIRAALHAHGLVTRPAFEDEWIDAELAFGDLVDGGTEPPASAPLSLDANLSSSGGTGAPEAPAPSTVPVEQLLPGVDPAVKVSHLPAANRPPMRIARDKPLVEATTRMLAHDYSQLPVMNGDREVLGMISWKSIGRAYALGKPVKTVADAMDTQVRIVRRVDSFYGAVQEVVAHEVVLVRDAERKICGIVTAADISAHFRTLAEPFLLLGEIERTLRLILMRRFDVLSLQAAKDSSDTKRVIEGVDDLTFGECVRLLEDPSRWGKLNTPLDRGVIVERLKVVNGLRNDVMHFDPDGVAPDDVDTIRRVAEFLLQWLGETGKP